MIEINLETCRGCNICVKNCPIDAIELKDKKAYTKQNCVSCGICARVCPFKSITKIVDETQEGYSVCTNCPVRCTIPLGATGACTRFSNKDGTIIRNRPLVVNVKPVTEEALNLVPNTTAVGAGSAYPCCRPAPFIVEQAQNDVDVVTVVTEAPLSYSGVKVKIDVNHYIGEEGAKVKRDGKIVGMVTTEEYGSKMLTLGGANLLSHGNDGFIVAKTIVDLANGRSVTLKVDEGATLELQQGKTPVIDGKAEEIMRVGCGSATIGMFAPQLASVVDEAIILDYHVVGLLSEHLAGAEVGMTYSGVVPTGTKSTRGRYFGKAGTGLGGTDIETFVGAVASVDMAIAKPGMKILVTETTGRKSGLLEVQADGSVKEISMTKEVQEVTQLITDTCETSSVSVIYTGGTGGSARAGVTTYPKKLTEAVHRDEVKLTIGGARAWVLPGGGINFMVDVSKMVENPITWVPTPATVAPVEYTMTKEKFIELGGHKANIITKDELLKKIGS